MPRILSIDYGLARIGLALSDPNKIIASPLKTLQAEKKLEQRALAVAQEIKCHDIETVVVGLPLHMDGSKGSQADEVEEFIRHLETHLSLPIVRWDERLTSVQAERTLRQGEMRRKKRSKVIDQVAAVLILQSYLDSLQAPSPQEMLLPGDLFFPEAPLPTKKRRRRS